MIMGHIGHRQKWFVAEMTRNLEILVLFLYFTPTLLYSQFHIVVDYIIAN